MINFVISGYFGFDNAGDEAILRSMVHSFKNTFPMCKITVLSNNPQKTAAYYEVNAVDRWNYKEVYSALKSSDCLISGGGSLLQDVTGTKSLGYYLAIVMLAKMLKKPVFFYAQGIGPVRTSFGKYLVRTIVNKVDYITVRDRQSELELFEMGVNKPKVTVTADAVLSMPPCTEVSHPKMVCISVREWQGESRFHKAIAEVCDDFCEAGYKVYFIPFQHPQDIEISKQIAARMTNKAYIAEEPLSIDEISCALAHAEVVIGMRYHALVLAAINNVPFIGIEYDPKVTNFLKQTGMPSAGKPDTLTALSLKNALHNIYSQKDRQEKLQERMANLQQQSLKTTELLQKFVNGEI